MCTASAPYLPEFFCNRFLALCRRNVIGIDRVGGGAHTSTTYMNALSGMHSEQSECLAGLAPNLAETKMYSMYMNTDPDNNNGTTGQFAKY
jgi:hypothetical protein